MFVVGWQIDLTTLFKRVSKNKKLSCYQRSLKRFSSCDRTRLCLSLRWKRRTRPFCFPDVLLDSFLLISLAKSSALCTDNKQISAINSRTFISSLTF